MTKNLKTKYMGIEIDNPIIIGASNLVTDLDKLKKAEEFALLPLFINHYLRNRFNSRNFNWMRSLLNLTI
jgi:hypothetical protein